MAGEGNGGDLIQVKLEVLDKGNSVVDHWMLPVEHVTIEITRQPVVFTIPTGPTDNAEYRQNRPMAYALDLSMMNEMIILSGVSIDNQQDPAQPSAPNLREIARTHWFGIQPAVDKDSGKFTAKGGIRLTINEGPGQGVHAYQGVIVNLTTERDGGDTKWSWKLTEQVFWWPWDMNP